MDIPAYPRFVAVGLEHKQVFERGFQEIQPTTSEFTFTNLYCWRQAYDFKIASFNGLLILRSDAAKTPRFFAPIGKSGIYPAIKRILEDSQGEFIRVPEELISDFAPDPNFILKEDTANADYVYLSADLIMLPGVKYDGKRNLIRNFKSSHKYHYEEITASNAKSIFDFQERWCASKDCQHVLGLYNERKAIQEMVANFAQFRLMAGAISIEGEICAVAIAEALNRQTLVTHVLKADASIAGLYQLMNNEFMRVNAKGFKYVNLEQDLGIPGLRKSKESYHPVLKIKKYSISLRS